MIDPRVQQRNAQLSELDDKLGVVIQEIEIRLRERLNVRISIDLDGELAGQALAFGRHAKNWGFVLYGVDGEPTPILSASRSMRAALIPWIGRLIVDAPAQLERMVAEREEAVRLAEGIVEACRTTPLEEEA